MRPSRTLTAALILFAAAPWPTSAQDGNGASASRSPPGSTTVNPGQASASIRAVERVRAIATCTWRPRPAASRRLPAARRAGRTAPGLRVNQSG